MNISKVFILTLAFLVVGSLGWVLANNQKPSNAKNEIATQKVISPISHRGNMLVSSQLDFQLALPSGYTVDSNIGDKRIGAVVELSKGTTDLSLMVRPNDFQSDPSAQEFGSWLTLVDQLPAPAAINKTTLANHMAFTAVEPLAAGGNINLVAILGPTHLVEFSSPQMTIEDLTILAGDVTFGK